MIETARAEAWLYETLSARAELAALVGSRIYRGAAPASATYPFVVFHFQASRDVVVVNGARLFSRLLYTVKAVDEGASAARAGQVADEVDAALHQAGGPAGADGRVSFSHRDGIVDYEEIVAGVKYQHRGGQYWLLVEPA